MIVNLRGGSCSGKSTPVYRLLANYPHVPLVEVGGWNVTKPRTVGYLVGDLLVVGPYEPQAKTGGLDMLLPGQTELACLWLKLQLSGGVRHAVYEAMTVSLSMGRWKQLARDLEPTPVGRTAFAFLDTPLEVRHERLLARSGGRGPSGKGINLEATLYHQHERLRTIRQRFIDEGELVFDVDHRVAYEQLVWLLQRAGWDPAASDPRVGEPVTLKQLGQLLDRERDHPWWPTEDRNRARLEKELADEKARRRLGI